MTRCAMRLQSVSSKKKYETDLFVLQCSVEPLVVARARRVVVVAGVEVHVVEQQVEVGQVAEVVGLL